MIIAQNVINNLIAAKKQGFNGRASYALSENHWKNTVFEKIQL